MTAQMLDWSHSRLTPFKHQYIDTQTVVDRPWFFIASEMRTGKTKIAIDAAQFLYDRGIIDRVIVIAPEPVRSVWVGPTADALGGELLEHLWLKTPALVTEFHSDVHQWRVGPDALPDNQTKPLRWIVTNYEFMRPYRPKNAKKKNEEILKTLLKYCGPKTMLVLDESGAITNHDSETFDACLTLRQKCGRVLLMNGTPMDTPIHMFSQGNMLHQSVLECKFITHFKSRYAVQEPVVSARTQKPVLTPYGKAVMKIVAWKNIDDLQARFKPFTVRRLQIDCDDMPVKLKPVTLTATLGSAAWNAYRKMRDDMVYELENGLASISQQAITKFMRLSQITGGFIGGIEDTGLDPVCPNCDGSGCEDCEGSGIGAAQPVSRVQELGREKLDVLLWLIESKLAQDPNLKMVVWSRFMPETLRIVFEATKKFPTMIVAGMHGGQSKKDRAHAKAILDPRTAPAGPVLVCGTLGTGSFGLDMSASHTSVNYSYDHSLRKFLQSGDRVYGPRQTSPVEYYDIVAVGPKGQKTYDAVIVQARRDKEQIANWTQEAWVARLSELTEAA